MNKENLEFLKELIILKKKFDELEKKIPHFEKTLESYDLLIKQRCEIIQRLNYEAVCLIKELRELKENVSSESLEKIFKICEIL